MPRQRRKYGIGSREIPSGAAGCKRSRLKPGGISSQPPETSQRTHPRFGRYKAARSGTRSRIARISSLESSILSNNLAAPTLSANSTVSSSVPNWPHTWSLHLLQRRTLARLFLLTFYFFVPTLRTVVFRGKPTKYLSGHVQSAFRGSAFRISPPRNGRPFHERNERSTWSVGKRREVAIATGTEPIGGGAARTASGASS